MHAAAAFGSSYPLTRSGVIVAWTRKGSMTVGSKIFGEGLSDGTP